jgi:hypothetical protein
MRTNPKAAFGYVVIVADVDAGEERDIKLTDEGYTTSGHYFYTKGRVKNHIVETGEVLEDRVAGWLNTEHPDGRASTPGTVHDVFLEDSQWLCIPYNLNNKKLPDLASLILTAGETATLTNGTNLYLVRGSLEINGKTFMGPTQIRIRSGDSTATSIGDTSYSLRFL